MIEFLFIVLFIGFLVFQFYLLDDRCTWEVADDLKGVVDGAHPIVVLILVGIVAFFASLVLILVVALIVTVWKALLGFLIVLAGVIGFLWLTRKITGVIFSLTNKRNSKESKK